MVKGNVAAVVGQFVPALLDRVVEDFIHAAHIGPHGNDYRQMQQSRLHGVIKAGHNQKVHKEGQHIHRPIDKLHRTHKGNGGDSQL